MELIKCQHNKWLLLFFNTLSILLSGFSVSKSGQNFSLSFKSYPCVSNPPYLTPRRPLFVGACAACTVHSGATLVNHELTSMLPLKNALSSISKLQLQSDLEHLATTDSPGMIEVL